MLTRPTANGVGIERRCMPASAAGEKASSLTSADPTAKPPGSVERGRRAERSGRMRYRGKPRIRTLSEFAQDGTGKLARTLQLGLPWSWPRTTVRAMDGSREEALTLEDIAPESRPAPWED